MGQVIFFALFIITLLAGAFVYFSPAEKPVNSVKYEQLLNDDKGVDPVETTSTTRDLQVDMKTNGGILQVLKELDDLSLEQKEYTDMIAQEEQSLKNAQQEVSALANQTLKNDRDLLRIKELGLQMQDEQDLLVANGHQLTDINDQLTQYRKLLSDQNNLVDISNRSSFESLQQHNDSVNDKASMFVDHVAQQSDDATRHGQDEQQKIQQHIADEQQRIRDRQGR